MSENAKDLLIASVPIVAAAIGWIVSEWARRKSELREKREQKYDDIIISLWGFYESMCSGGRIDYTIGNRAWLHCPDSVIIHIMDFQDSVKLNPLDKASAKRKLGELILEIRRNHYSKCTMLTVSDWIKQVKD